MPHWIAILALGIIEGLTEFIPVSSTGHLLLAEQWLGHQTDLFNVVIQCGAVLAVLVIFTGRVKQLLFDWKTPAAQDYAFKLAAAFVITGIGGLILEKLHFKLPEDPAPVALATLIGGPAILAIERYARRRTLTDQISWPVALAVGASQLAAAVFPGTSRSGITIMIALGMGASRPSATEFSFLLGIPTLLAAGGLKIFEAFKHGEAASTDWGMIGLGTAAAAVTAFGVVRWLLRFVRSHTFDGFGWYRILLGVAILALMR